eukprot:gnl/MRDRNA2_/MRDRNA2_185410_c0_seq1.p1 gnl/MRDRNA2_/MRDRNA2_185410_c0~~gnl/MRDRNA2_/MRDRNA2_185410_c0_seq1.p1  ORF type:complete len:191 (+),score=22.28 gnl/MRDRNA2_/MRDRNA2_185410_c0_seq1:2-574(+)
MPETLETISVSVRMLSGKSLGVFQVEPSQRVFELKQQINDSGGPLPSEQKLIAGFLVLEDEDDVWESLRANELDMVFCITVEGCPTCKGPCSCTLCHCKPHFGLFDYYGVCRECGQCGGHSSNCELCLQRFPSLRALDFHIKFAHPSHDQDSGRAARLDEDKVKRNDPGFRLPNVAQGTFLEATRGGLGD